MKNLAKQVSRIIGTRKDYLKSLERRLIAAQLARDHALAAELAEAIERLREEEE